MLSGRRHLLAIALAGVIGCGDDEGSTTGPEPEPVPREPTAASCVAPPSAMVAWWPGEDDAEDIAGNHEGREEGPLGYAAGYVGRAFKLGSGAAVLLDEVPRSSAFTVEGWIWLESAGGLRQAVYGSVVAGLQLRNDRLVWYQDRDTDSSNGVNWIGDPQGDRFVGSPVERRTWQHVALTYDSQAFRSYVNGELTHEKEFRGAIMAYGQPTINRGIGMWARNDFPFWFAGLIDELTIYDRALKAQEIEQIWDAGSKGKCRT